MLAVRLAYKSSSTFFPEREAGAADFLFSSEIASDRAGTRFVSPAKNRI